ncbi:MAG: M28 family metallopeptidase [Solirubrobacterales bacterium]
MNFFRASRLPPLLLIGALIALLGVVGCGSQTSGKEADQPPDRFNAESAMNWVERQVAVGQRPAGSPQLRELAIALREQLPNGHFESIPNEPRLRNVVGTLYGPRPGIVIAAHYDTLVKPRGFVGANNGAAGTAVVLQVAWSLATNVPPSFAREVRFVLFDGEEPPAGLPEEGEDFYNEGLRGSRAYVEQNPNQTKAMVLLDYVGNEGLRLPREATSTPGIWKKVLLNADDAGVGEFFSAETGPAIVDDHTPFLRSGVPAVDLIDWSYPGHSLEDGLDKISTRSLDAVGETVVRLVNELRSE